MEIQHTETESVMFQKKLIKMGRDCQIHC